MSRKRPPVGLTSDSQPHTKFPRSSQKPSFPSPILSPKPYAFHNRNFVQEPRNFCGPIRGRQLEWLLSQITSFVNPLLRIQEEEKNFENRKVKKKSGCCKGLVKDHFWIGLSEVGKALERMDVGGESEESNLVSAKNSGESGKNILLLGKNSGDSDESTIVLRKISGESEKNGIGNEQNFNDGVKNLVGSSENDLNMEIVLTPGNIQSRCGETELVDEEKSKKSAKAGEILEENCQKDNFSFMELERQFESDSKYKNDSFPESTFGKDDKKNPVIDTVDKGGGEEQEGEEGKRKEQGREVQERDEEEREEQEREKPGGEEKEGEERGRKEKERGELEKKGKEREEQERKEKEAEELSIKEKEGEEQERKENEREERERKELESKEKAREEPERKEKEGEKQERTEQAREERERKGKEGGGKEREERERLEKDSKVLLVIYAADVYPRHLVSHLNFLTKFKKVPVVTISGEDGSGSVRLGKALGLRTVTAIGFKGNLEKFEGLGNLKGVSGNLGGEGLGNRLLKGLLSFVEGGGVVPV